LWPIVERLAALRWITPAGRMKTADHEKHENDSHGAKRYSILPPTCRAREA
jgi:hypothetical protein